MAVAARPGDAAALLAPRRCELRDAGGPSSAASLPAGPPSRPGPKPAADVQAEGWSAPVAAAPSTARSPSRGGRPGRAGRRALPGDPGAEPRRRWRSRLLLGGLAVQQARRRARPRRTRPRRRGCASWSASSSMPSGSPPWAGWRPASPTRSTTRSRAWPTTCRLAEDALARGDCRGGGAPAPGRHARASIAPRASCARCWPTPTRPRRPRRRWTSTASCAETVEFVRSRTRVCWHRRFDDSSSRASRCVTLGSPIMLGQVASNLVINACEAQPRGGEVQRGVAAGRRAVVVEVADRGPGVAEADRAARSSSRSSPPRTRPASGSVDLSLHRREHGGELRVAAAARRRRLFRMRLPAHGGARGHAAAQDRPRRASSWSRTRPTFATRWWSAARAGLRGAGRAPGVDEALDGARALAGRRGAHRPQDAGAHRARPRAPACRPRPRRARDRPDRPRHRRLRRRVPEGGRRRLHPEAGRPRRPSRWRSSARSRRARCGARCAYLRGARRGRGAAAGQEPGLDEGLAMVRGRGAHRLRRCCCAASRAPARSCWRGCIHRSRARARGPYVRVNCAAVPLEIWESEFFGHRKGAFTGAASRPRGPVPPRRRRHAFLDEVGAMPRAGPGQAAARHPGRRVRPAGRRAADARGRAHRGRHQQRPRGRHQGRATSAQDLYYRLDVLQHPGARPCASGPRTSRSWPSASRPRSRARLGREAPVAAAETAARLAVVLTGPATCASCRT